jgi:ABC-2 type transport system ATP-binding protein
VRETLTRSAGFYPNPRSVDEVLGLVGLEDKADARVNKLSGGQQRRLDVAYGIIGNPRLLFLDEPTTGFDPSARRGAWEMVGGLRQLGTTIMLTTHYMEEAQALADNIIVIGNGQVVAEGAPDALGGRDTAAAHIRFRLPLGTDPALLPLTMTTDQHGYCELTTDEDIKVMHALTSWSLTNDVPLEGLVMTRPSLEDIYLSLVGSAALDQPEPVQVAR